MPPYRVGATGLRLAVRVTPKSSTDGIDGLHMASDGTVSLKLRVRAQPEKGKANKAAIAVVAKALGVAKSCVSVSAGAKDRNKTLLIEGSPSELTAVIDALIDADE